MWFSADPTTLKCAAFGSGKIREFDSHFKEAGTQTLFSCPLEKKTKTPFHQKSKQDAVFSAGREAHLQVCLQTVSTSLRLLMCSVQRSRQSQAFNSNRSERCHAARWRARSSFIQERYCYLLQDRKELPWFLCIHTKGGKKGAKHVTSTPQVYFNHVSMTQSGSAGCLQSISLLCLTTVPAFTIHFSKLQHIYWNQEFP